MIWHAPTLLLFSALLMLSFLLGTAMLWWRDRSPHLRDWSIGNGLSLIGMALLAHQSQLPEWAGIWLANLCALGGMAWINAGLARLLDQPYRLQLVLPQGLAVALGYALISLVWDLPAWRVILFNLAMLLMVAAALQYLWRAAPLLGRPVLLLPLLLYSCVGLASLARIGSALWNLDSDREQLWALQGPLIALVLLASVANLQALMTLHSARLLAQAERQAASDALTGLLNRRGFEPLLEREWQRYQRGEQALALLMLDVDHFKAINDGYGHAVGDRALQYLGRELHKRLRPYDTAARLGGEEFVVLLPGSDTAQALQTAERLRQLDWVYAEDQDARPLRFTLSVGLACAQAGDAGPQTLLQRADAALYRAKQAGRDRVMEG